MGPADATVRAVRLLHDVGERHGRPPAPVPEVDPWDDGDPLAVAPDGVTVDFPGVPAVVVRLHGDGQDVVVVEDVVELDVPRADTPAVVDSILGGRARRRTRYRNVLETLLGTLLHNPVPAELVVEVGPRGSGRTYRAPIVFTMASGRWLGTLPEA